ncbi:MAG TPA: asparagine synthase (glutamine-hydrolyzing) [Vicinamibacterales bacterium]|nr:asparagine synthase (glutamine-hydrolyzing) [Vicinamibacterales bacterium]
MCGFAGILAARSSAARDLTHDVARMIRPLTHRGPDDEGVWVDEAAGIALGFRRLAIIDLSPSGHQPMTSASGRFHLVFNGEIYNFCELRQQLEGLGHRFRGHSDTEVILAAFEQWGIREAITRAVGMFAMAVWDTTVRELSLVRDRLGKKPLFVYHQSGLVTFGSELKALVSGPSFDRTINTQALQSYLRYLYVPAPQCIFQQVVKIPAGHILTIRDARHPLPPSTSYWSLSDVARAGLESQFDGTDEDAVDELDRLLGDAVCRRLQSDVPLGALLSGGIDSSAVVALMQEKSSRPTRTYTIGFDDDAFDEASHAARVAESLGTDHTALHLTGEDARSLVPRLPYIFDEPLADPSELPTLLVSQLARRDVTVALSGDGGDELFGGYNRYVYGTRVLPRVDRIPRPLRLAVAAGVRCVPSGAWDRLAALSTIVPGLPASRVGERIGKLTHVMAASSVGDMYCSLLSAWQRPAHLANHHRTIDDVNASVLDAAEPVELLDRMMLADQMTYLPDDLLAKLDRASMAVSLEVRAPLLDHRVVEFSWRLPRRFKLRDGIGKWILRQVLYRRVPKAIVERPKMGFSVPIDRWLRGPLRGWADGFLNLTELRRAGLPNPTEIIRSWRDLQAGRAANGTRVWAVIMFQAWRARWTS